MDGRERPTAQQLFARGQDAMRRAAISDDSDALDEAIQLLEAARLAAEPTFEPRFRLSRSLGVALWTRFSVADAEADLDRAIEAFDEALSFMAPDEPLASAVLSLLIDSMWTRFERAGSGEDLDRVIEVLGFSLLHGGDLADKSKLAKALSARFSRTAANADLHLVIGLHQQIIAALPVGHAARTSHQYVLGQHLRILFTVTHEGADLDAAIDCYQDVLAATEVGDPVRHHAVVDAAPLMLARFDAGVGEDVLGEQADLDRAIMLFEEALSGLHTRDERRLPLLSLARALSERAARTSNTEDLDRAIVLYSHAVDTAPAHPLHRTASLSDLAGALVARAEMTRRGSDLDDAIALYREALNGAPAERLLQGSVRLNLGNALTVRAKRVSATDDLDEAIDVYGDALAVTPDNDQNRTKILTGFANALTIRFERTSRPADLDRAIECGEAAIAASTDATADALAIRRLNLGVALRNRFEHGGACDDLERAIELFDAARSPLPQGHTLQLTLAVNLGHALFRRFERYGDRSDLDRAILVGDAVPRPARLDQPDWPDVLCTLGNAHLMRYEHFGRTRDLDLAIVRFKAALDSSPETHPDRVTYLGALGVAFERRFKRTGNAGDLDAAICNGEAAVGSDLPNRPASAGHLSNLALALMTRFHRTHDTSDIDRAIALNEQAEEALPADHPSLPGVLNNLGAALTTRFFHLESDGDLEAAITALEKADLVTAQADHPDRVRFLYNLADAIEERFAQTCAPADRDRAVRLFREAAEQPTGPALYRATAARRMGQLATRGETPDWDAAVTGYAFAIEMAAWVSPRDLERSDQEFRIRELDGLGCEAAAAAIAAGKCRRAVELFEQGRAITFSQTLDTRSDLTELTDTHPDVARQFIQVRDRLDTVGATSSAGVLPESESADLLDRTIAARKAAAIDFERTLAEIRSLPGFDRFLLPRSLAELLPAASDGPIVLLNVAELRSDALILTPNIDDITVLPLNGVNPTAVTEQFVTFLRALDRIRPGAARDVLDEADDALRSVLNWLGDRITAPVLDYLGYRAIGPAPGSWPRVWWCASGVLAFLPIHAAGRHYPSSTDAVIDRVISSTTPTLRALLHSRAQKAEVDAPRVLIVAMPATAHAAQLNGVATEAAVVQMLYGTRATVLGLSEHTPADHDRVLAALAQHHYVHFACHGFSDLSDPASSYLQLNDRALTLTDLASSRTAEAELAFLSSCTTARAGIGAPNEPIHLAAACQLAGYRHVIGSLWTIDDYQTQQLATDFYTTLTTTEAGPAAALHHATRQLRTTSAQRPHLWAPYTHTGP